MNDLEQLKQIDLVEFVTRYGYQLDKAKTGKADRADQVMRRESDDDKLLVKETDSGWVWCSCRDWSLRGCIVDFVMTQDRIGFVEAIQRLRGQSPTTFSSHKSLKVQHNSATRGEIDAYQKTLAVWKAARSTANNPYLLGRCLSEATLNDPRFKEKHRLTWQGATIFPHFDRGGMCGLERRGIHLKAFEKGTKKGLWYSAGLTQAPAIVVCEATIDCLSHSQLHPSDAGYVSFAGEIGHLQRELLTSLVEKAAQRSVRVFCATDNDRQGDHYFDVLSALSDGVMERITPNRKDWNADLIATLKTQ